jgi:hypothetical protein
MLNTTHIVASSDIRSKLVEFNYCGIVKTEPVFEFYEDIVEMDDLAILKVRADGFVLYKNSVGVSHTLPKRIIDKLIKYRPDTEFLYDLKHGKLIYNITDKIPEALFFDSPIELLYKPTYLGTTGKFLIVMTASRIIGKMPAESYHNLIGYAVVRNKLPSFFGVGIEPQSTYMGTHIILDILASQYGFSHTLPTNFTDLSETPLRCIETFSDRMPKNNEFLLDFKTYYSKLTEQKPKEVKGTEETMDSKNLLSPPRNPEGKILLSEILDGVEDLPTANYTLPVENDITPQQLASYYKIFSEISYCWTKDGKLGICFYGGVHGESIQYIRDQLTGRSAAEIDIEVILNSRSFNNVQ